MRDTERQFAADLACSTAQKPAGQVVWPSKLDNSFCYVSWPARVLRVLKIEYDII